MLVAISTDSTRDGGNLAGACNREGYPWIASVHILQQALVIESAWMRHGLCIGLTLVAISIVSTGDSSNLAGAWGGEASP